MIQHLKLQLQFWIDFFKKCRIFWVITKRLLLSKRYEKHLEKTLRNIAEK